MVHGDWLAGGDRKELGRTAIRRAARELLLERGPARFSVEAVAARAGCSRATLYRMTGGRRALLDAVLADAAAEVGARVLNGIDGLTGAERTVQAILIALREIRADPAVLSWVRSAATADGTISASSDLSALAVSLTDVEGGDHAGDWIVRVVLALVLWPATSPKVEEAIVRTYVAPGFG